MSPIFHHTSAVKLKYLLTENEPCQGLLSSSATRRLDLSQFRVVRIGTPCKLEPPVHPSQLIQKLEKQESTVYWLQPLSGEVEDQVAAVSINGDMYSMSLRLEKAVFRHFRLTKNFSNIEYLEDGTPKLRIPVRLLREKQRTSLRHLVSCLL